MWAVKTRKISNESGFGSETSDEREVETIIETRSKMASDSGTASSDNEEQETG